MLGGTGSRDGRTFSPFATNGPLRTSGTVSGLCLLCLLRNHNYGWTNHQLSKPSGEAEPLFLRKRRWLIYEKAVRSLAPSSQFTYRHTPRPILCMSEQYTLRGVSHPFWCIISVQDIWFSHTCIFQ